MFGWEIGLIAAGVHATAYILGGGAINAIGHKWGKRPHDNLATNNQWLAWLVAGEGLHNNHHAATTSGRMSMAKGEVDPGWWAVRALVLMRLATVRHNPRATRSLDRLKAPVGRRLYGGLHLGSGRRRLRWSPPQTGEADGESFGSELLEHET